ncbi:thioesterase family protein (plasmid) [Rhizobium sp. CB3171]|uniref:acyl-CoA thioesterase n=1 Tax=Rhizobium sp. CB3171 TaxID=3039157 RepID=UPI0024B0F33C|nr:thioesterase family protein [Rhizobium sp. CB3171]WFU05772.1 thioesterase family protein [Rhizobium sp. CB3171]
MTTAIAHQWMCDHFGHLNVRNYAAIFDDAIFVFWSKYGASNQGSVPVTATLKIDFRSEVLAGTVLAISSKITRIGTKSVNFGLEMTNTDTNEVVASCDVVDVFFSLQDRKSMPIPERTRAKLLTDQKLTAAD